MAALKGFGEYIPLIAGLSTATYLFAKITPPQNTSSNTPSHSSSSEHAPESSHIDSEFKSIDTTPIESRLSNATPAFTENNPTTSDNLKESLANKTARRNITNCRTITRNKSRRM